MAYKVLGLALLAHNPVAAPFRRTDARRQEYYRVHSQYRLPQVSCPTRFALGKILLPASDLARSP